MTINLCPSKDDWIYVERNGSSFRLSYLDFCNNYQSIIDPHYSQAVNRPLLPTDLLLVGENDNAYKIQWRNITPTSFTVEEPEPFTLNQGETPFDISSTAPEVWLDADDESTVITDIFNSNQVIRWENKGTIGATGDAVSTATHPLLENNSHNNKNGIYFFSEDHNVGGNVTIDNGSGTVIIVGKMYLSRTQAGSGSVGTNTCVTLQYPPRITFATTANNRWEPLAEVGQLLSYSGGAGGHSTTTSIHRQTSLRTARLRSRPNEVEVVGSVINSTSNLHYVFVNEAESENSEISNGFTTTMSQYKLMNNTAYATLRMFGVLYEVLIWNRALGQEELTNIKRSLYLKWQPPYISERPVYTFPANPFYNLKNTNWFYVQRENQLSYRAAWTDMQPRIFNWSIFVFRSQLSYTFISELNQQIIVDWGDGVVEEFRTGSVRTHVYANQGLYYLRVISGTNLTLHLTDVEAINSSANTNEVLVEYRGLYNSRFGGIKWLTANDNARNPVTESPQQSDTGYYRPRSGLGEIKPPFDLSLIGSAQFEQRGIFGEQGWVPLDDILTQSFTGRLSMSKFFHSNMTLRELPWLDLSLCQSIEEMCCNCKELRSIAANIPVTNVTNADSAFAVCEQLEEFPGMILPNLISANNMFHRTPRMIAITGILDLSNATRVNSLFRETPLLSDLSNVIPPTAPTEASAIFLNAGTKNSIEGWNFELITSADFMFAGTTILAVDSNLALASARNFNNTFSSALLPAAALSRIHPSIQLATDLRGAFFNYRGELPAEYNIIIANAVTANNALSFFEVLNSPQPNLVDFTFRADLLTTTQETLGTTSITGTLTLILPNAVSALSICLRSNGGARPNISGVSSNTVFNPNAALGDMFDSMTNLVNFPGSILNGHINTNFSNCWRNCALNVTSVDSILSVLNNNGQSNGILTLAGGSNATPTGGLANPDLVALVGRGWTVSINV